MYYLKLVSEKEDFGLGCCCTTIHFSHSRITQCCLCPFGLRQPLHDGLKAFLKSMDLFEKKKQYKYIKS